MKARRCVTIKKIENVTYLLPYGQSVADCIRGVEINETGELIWGYLQEDRTLSEIVQFVTNYYEADSDDELKAVIEADIKTFLKILESHRLIEEGSGKTTLQASEEHNKAPEVDGEYCIEDLNKQCGDSDSKTICIGNITICLRGNSQFYHKRFDDFLYGEKLTDTDSSKLDMEILLSHKSIGVPQTAKLVIQNEILTIYECEKYYHISFPINHSLKRLILEKNGKIAIFFYEGEDQNIIREELFFAIGHALVYKALLQDMIMLHSASILYKDKLWLFSGPSGTGKSTHTGLWKKLYDVELINGDLNLIGMEDGVPYVYGTPWCGTSEIYDNKRYPLGGIVLLKQAPYDQVRELDSSKKILKVNQRLISPTWDEEMFQHTLELTQTVVEKVMVSQLDCTMRDHAAMAMKDAIDKLD